MSVRHVEVLARIRPNYRDFDEKCRYRLNFWRMICRNFDQFCRSIITLSVEG